MSGFVLQDDPSLYYTPSPDFATDGTPLSRELHVCQPLSSKARPFSSGEIPQIFVFWLPHSFLWFGTWRAFTFFVPQHSFHSLPFNGRFGHYFRGWRDLPWPRLHIDLDLVLCILVCSFILLGKIKYGAFWCVSRIAGNPSAGAVYQDPIQCIMQLDLTDIFPYQLKMEVWSSSLSESFLLWKASFLRSHGGCIWTRYSDKGRTICFHQFFFCDRGEPNFQKGFRKIH